MEKQTHIIKLKCCISILFLFVLPSLSFSQTKGVTGVVTSAEDGLGTIGVSVVEKGTTNGTTTDIEGKYQIQLTRESATLVFSMIGMVAQEKTVRNGDVVDVVLSENQQLLDEVVVTGYTSERKVDITGSVSVVKMKDIANIPTGNVLSSLQGRVPGVNITTDGTPGGMNTSTLIRGTTTINDSSPLYVIDGVMTRDNIASILSSNDVESIQVLKDAASAAIYGAQAANGVIIITTKRAKKGEIKVDFDMSLTAQTFTTGIDLLNTQQWGDVYWQAYKYSYGVTPNSAVYGNGETAVPQEYYYNTDKLKIRTANTDWAKEIYSTSLMQNYNVTLSKGADNGSTSLTLNYMDQDGLIRNTDFKRLNTRLTSDYHFLNNRLRIGESISINRWTRHLNPGGIEEQVLAQHPAIPIYDENGGYAGGYVDILGDKPNMIRLTDNEKNNRHTYWRIFGNAYIEVEPVKNLILKSNFGINYYNEFNSVFIPSWQEGSRTVKTNELTTSNAYKYNWVSSNTAAYNFTINKHSASALLGFEAKKDYSEHLNGYGTNLSIEDTNYLYLDGVTAGQTVGNNASTYAMVSVFGRANYSYDGKYLLSGTLRRDASSRFGSKKNYGYFPSVSGGWRISSEPFMSTTTNWLSDLKLRASWGINGNDMIDNEATYTKYIVSLRDASYNISGDGSILAPGAFKDITGNPLLKWEQTTQTNIGIDAAFLNNRMGIAFDYFNKDTKDMLIKRDYIAVIGEGGYYWYNGISMNNKGFEVTLNWRDNIKDFNYEIALNLSYYKNKVTDLPSDIYYTYGGGNGTDKTIVGKPLGSWMGYKTDGIFRTQEEVNEYNSKYDVQIGEAGIGRVKYQDINDDGKINTADQTWLGSDRPKLIGGLNLAASYKGFDINMFFNGMVRDAWNNSKYYTDFFQLWTGNHSTRLLSALSAWKEYEQTGVYKSDIPALTVDNKNNEERGSDYYIENGSYIKLKSLTLGYTLPNKLMSRLKLRNARVYIQSQNLFTITKYKGADPEGLGYTYPLPRTYTLGLSFGF